MKHTFHAAAVLFLAILGMTGCQKDEPATFAPAHVEFRLVDATASYDEVNIDIQEVRIHIDGSGWQTLATNVGVYNILLYTNGLDTLLAGQDVPAGKISQIRLVLGANNTLVMNGTVYPLETPSAQQSGLKLNVHETLEGGISYRFLLDFDAARSIVEKGNGTYSLKPVIRVISESVSGAISGDIDPDGAVAVYAFAGNDTIGTMSDSIGQFLISGVPAGTWDVYIPATQPGVSDTTLTGVVVSQGQVTNLGTISL